MKLIISLIFRRKNRITHRIFIPTVLIRDRYKSRLVTAGNRYSLFRPVRTGPELLTLIKDPLFVKPESCGLLIKFNFDV